jgi:hypothetical protein
MTETPRPAKHGKLSGRAINPIKDSSRKLNNKHGESFIKKRNP